MNRRGVALLVLALAAFGGALGSAPPPADSENAWLASRFGSGASDYVVSIGRAHGGEGSIAVAGSYGGQLAVPRELHHSGGRDTFVAAVRESTGEPAWAAGFGGTGDDLPSAVAVGSEGDIYVCGIFQATVNFVGAPGAAAALQMRGGRSGERSLSSGSFDVASYCARFDGELGALLWVVPMLASADAWASGCAVDDGRLSVVILTVGAFVSVGGDADGAGSGSLTSSSQRWDSFLVALDTETGHYRGDESRQLDDPGGTVDCFFRSVAPLASSSATGSLVLAGQFHDVLPWLSASVFPRTGDPIDPSRFMLAAYGGEWGDVAILRLDEGSRGTIAWITQLGGVGSDFVTSTGGVASHDASVVAGGDFSSPVIFVGDVDTGILAQGFGDVDGWVTCLDSGSGQPRWLAAFGGSGVDFTFAVAIEAEGSSVWAVGSSESESVQAHTSGVDGVQSFHVGAAEDVRTAVLLRIDLDSGVISFATRLGSPSGDDQLTGVVVSGSAFVVAMATSSEAITIGPGVGGDGAVVPEVTLAGTGDGAGGVDGVVLRLDCLLSQWSGWSECSVECGGGTRTRHRGRVVPRPDHMCVGHVLTESRVCNAAACLQCESAEAVLSRLEQASSNSVPAVGECIASSAATEPANHSSLCELACEGGLQSLVQAMRCDGGSGEWVTVDDATPLSQKTDSLFCAFPPPTVSPVTGVDPLTVTISAEAEGLEGVVYKLASQYKELRCGIGESGGRQENPVYVVVHRSDSLITKSCGVGAQPSPEVIVELTVNAAAPAVETRGGNPVVATFTYPPNAITDAPTLHVSEVPISCVNASLVETVARRSSVSVLVSSAERETKEKTLYVASCADGLHDPGRPIAVALPGLSDDDMAYPGVAYGVHLEFDSRFADGATIEVATVINSLTSEAAELLVVSKLRLAIENVELTDAGTSVVDVLVGPAGSWTVAAGLDRHDSVAADASIGNDARTSHGLAERVVQSVVQRDEFLVSRTQWLRRAVSAVKGPVLQCADGSLRIVGCLGSDEDDPVGAQETDAFGSIENQSGESDIDSVEQAAVVVMVAVLCIAVCLGVVNRIQLHRLEQHRIRVLLHGGAVAPETPLGSVRIEQAGGGEAPPGGEGASQCQPSDDEHDDGECVVCMDNRRQVVLYPCEHLCMCVACSRRVTQCPLCREPVVTRMELR